MTGMNGSTTSAATPSLTSFLAKTTNGPIISMNALNKVNGHKEEFNGLDEKHQADKENEEAEIDKKLVDSSKSFANLIKANQMSGIPLTGTTVTAAFTFKSAETPRLAEKDSNAVGSSQPSSLFKVGVTGPTNNLPFGSNALSTAAATIRDR